MRLRSILGEIGIIPGLQGTASYIVRGLDYPTIVSKIADKTGEPKPVDPKIEKLIKTILSQEIKGKRLKKDGLLYIPRKQ